LQLDSFDAFFGRLRSGHGLELGASEQDSDHLSSRRLPGIVLALLAEPKMGLNGSDPSQRRKKRRQQKGAQDHALIPCAQDVAGEVRLVEKPSQVVLIMDRFGGAELGFPGINEL